jgi:pilus assembly protein CpaB
MRDVAISVKANTTAGGFVSPGDHVDVILAYGIQIDSDDKKYASFLGKRYASQTILSNIRVLAVDQTAKDETREAKVAKTVTLEVTREQAETLALADRMGDLTLALRRIGDETVVPVKAMNLTTDTHLSNLLRQLSQIKRQVEEHEKHDFVRVYNGTSVQNVPVQPDTNP